MDEKKDLWNILTALRGPDHENDDAVKAITTCRIRGELLGTKHSRLIRKKCIIYRSPTTYTDPSGTFEISTFHFKFHAKDAIRALEKHVPKERIKDLLRLL
jgi:hypothetical protein